MMRLLEFVALNLCILFFSESLVAATQISNPLFQTESELSRFSKALSDYKLDYDNFPENAPEPPYGLERLTSPVPYISQIMVDCFMGHQMITEQSDNIREKRFYRYRNLLILLFMLWGFLTLFIFMMLCKHIQLKRKIFKNEILLLSALLWFIFAFLYISFCMNSHSNFRYFWQIINVKQYPFRLFDSCNLKLPDNPNRTFHYSLSFDKDAFVWSPGPDYQTNFTSNIVSTKTTKELLDSFTTYSATNGIYSYGDLWFMIPRKYPKEKLVYGFNQHE